METSERLWWLRALLVLQAPRPVFAALRDDSDDAAEARQEPLVAIVLLAGIAGVLGTSIAGRLLDDPAFDGLVVLVWAIVGGGFYGLAGYFLAGALLYLAASMLGSLGSYRRARHMLGFAAVPIALSLLVWPVRLALYGSDAFRSGGADDGAGGDAFVAAQAGFVAWALVLLAIGVRTVHGWSWPRSLAAAALPAALPALAFARAFGVV
ncbi:MAG: YIP1 family protein [Actinomycetota bacterium]|nr:YIP1 family protein [Actinomycetota bacterium]